MLSENDKALLETIADMKGTPEGAAYNIRKDCSCSGRESSENIEIRDKKDGKAGIDIIIKPGTKKETCYIPVIITESGIKEDVYNDFYVGEGADVTIVAGCGIHNCGEEESRHEGIHCFHIGKNAKVHYIEKHYGEGDGNGKNVMNPETICYLEEGAFMKMDTAQIKGIDSTNRNTKIVCGKGADVLVTERLQTHGKQYAKSDMEIILDGEDSRGRVISRSVAGDNSEQIFFPKMTGNAKCFGHVQCDSIIMDSAKISSIPAIIANSTEAELIHEAANVKIAGAQ
ncbi:MAG: SufD family Fe-S cluster assembly protein, partial [Oscillospiraceae bacterium]|nr:SufD family Fe-S cluster assembly protein [Oscillospiraceae bacterium]